MYCQPVSGHFSSCFKQSKQSPAVEVGYLRMYCTTIPFLHTTTNCPTTVHYIVQFTADVYCKFPIAEKKTNIVTFYI